MPDKPSHSPAAAPPRRLLIVGGVAGGASTAARARRLSEDCEIILFERGPHVSFANCGLPYFVGGEIPDKEDLLVQTPESLKARFNLEVRVNTEVMAINPFMHKVTVRNRLTGEETTESYDKLVLATGAAPIRPPIPGIDRPNHFLVRNVPDVEQITAWAESSGQKRVVVVGGGYIGLEMAEQLRHRGLTVTLVEALPQVMAPLDPEMAAWLHAELRDHGVALHLNDAVAAFEAPSASEPAGASIVVLKSGQRLPADAVIVGLGVKPESALAKTAGLELGQLGGIRVNDQMRTSDPDIYAVGDVVEVKDGVTGQWSLIPLAGPANRQGRIVADVIFGRDSRYGGTWGTAVLRLFRLTAACTGANAGRLRRAGIPFEVVHLHPGSHAGYFPGAEPIALKLLFAPDTGKLLGAQAVGRDGVDKRMDVIATALQAGMTVHDLAELELCYAPPFGSAKDPVNLAGMTAQNVLSGAVSQIQWDEVAGLNPDTTVILDVRGGDERAAGFIPGSIHIPMNELRKRIGEVPRDREIVAYCASGLRSYVAARFLGQHGFHVKIFPEPTAPGGPPPAPDKAAICVCPGQFSCPPAAILTKPKLMKIPSIPYQLQRVPAVLALLLSMVHLARSQGPGGGQGRGPGGGPHGGEDGFQQAIHQLFDNHEKIKRTVEMTADGYKSRTISEDPEVAKTLQKHVRQMRERLGAGLMIRRWDPAFAELVEHYKDIDHEFKEVEGGVEMIAKGKTPDAVKVAQNHAKIVSGFARIGPDQMHESHPRALRAGDKPANAAPAAPAPVPPAVCPECAVAAKPSLPGSPATVIPLEVRGNLRIVYQVTDDLRQDGVNRGLFYARKLLDTYAAQGIAADQVHLHLVYHGTGIAAVVNGAGLAKLGSADPNPNQELLADLMRRGVAVELCENTMQQKGIVPEQLIPGVKLVVGAFPRLVDLQLQGFAYIKFE